MQGGQVPVQPAQPIQAAPASQPIVQQPVQSTPISQPVSVVEPISTTSQPIEEETGDFSAEDFADMSDEPVDFSSGFDEMEEIPF